MRTRRLSSLFVLFSLLALAGLRQNAWSQEVTAGIVGTVTDPTGAPINGATVTATDTERGTVWTATTNESGTYSISRIPVDHDETFEDVALSAGIGQATRMMSGWGLKFFDYDNDGNLDLFLANGNPDDLVNELTHNQVSYQEPMLLFHNTGKGLENVSGGSGPLFARKLSARGLAIGDFDNDGAVDVLVSVNDGPPLLLRNRAAAQHHWLGLQLVGKKSNPDAVGACVTWQAGELKRRRLKVGGGSYLSSHDPRIVLGIGKRTKIDWLEVTWPQPSGRTERFTDLPIDRYLAIVEGQGQWK